MSLKDSTIITRFELVEVTVPATATREIEFPTSSNLQNDTDQKIIITDIEVYPVYVQTGSIRTSGVGVLPVLEIPKVSLVWYYQGGEWIRNIPLAKLIYITPPIGTASPFSMERVAFDMLQDCAIDKCKVVYNTAPAGLPYVIPFGITYIKLVPNTSL